MTFGATVVGLVILLAVLAPVVVTRDPITQNLALANRPPAWQARGSIQAPLGTDQFGRDVWSRIVYGAQISLAIGTTAALLGAVVGVSAGLAAGFYGGKVDILVMRIVDLNLAFPLILLALAIAAILGPSLQNLILVMALTTWMIYARVVRGVTLSIREREFIQAARAIGVSNVRIMWRHILPNLMAPVLVIFTLELARVILMESALSFLGVGVPPPTPTWGRMLAEGRNVLTTAPWIATFPGVAITLTVLGVNLFGDGLRDLLDPRLRKQT
ncbi:MAG: ABC transporter permease [Chloroflexi bacterium]|nr:ABC transporter permease [Chloroflexota bacterium]